jgi:dihydrofolate reductase
MDTPKEIDKKPEAGRIALIAALGARTRAIGKNGALLWHLPEDLKRFKRITDGHPVIMGRKTWESLPQKVRPLPGRANIVLTHNAAEYEAPGAFVAHSIEHALALAKGEAGAEEIFFIGGADVYAEALPHAGRLYLTLVDSDADGDAFFPEYEADFLKVAERIAVVDSDPTYTWLTLDRGAP